jgi:hypothetical protein
MDSNGGIPQVETIGMGDTATFTSLSPSVWVPSDGVFGHFDLVALCGCHTLNVSCLFVSVST